MQYDVWCNYAWDICYTFSLNMRDWSLYHYLTELYKNMYMFEKQDFGNSIAICFGEKCMFSDYKDHVITTFSQEYLAEYAVSRRRRWSQWWGWQQGWSGSRKGASPTPLQSSGGILASLTHLFQWTYLTEITFFNKLFYIF